MYNAKLVAVPQKTSDIEDGSANTSSGNFGGEQKKIDRKSVV